EEYLIYQTLLGAWPPGPFAPGEREQFVQRMRAYVVKALHEAKVHSSWINPNEEYDAAVQEFVAGILDEGAGRGFLDDFLPFQRGTSHSGRLNSLAQTLRKVALRGVPDTYRGAELWDLSLVDPDNRRPVDYAHRRALLAGLDERERAAGP